MELSDDRNNFMDKNKELKDLLQKTHKQYREVKNTLKAYKKSAKNSQAPPVEPSSELQGTQVIRQRHPDYTTRRNSRRDNSNKNTAKKGAQDYFSQSETDQETSCALIMKNTQLKIRVKNLKESLLFKDEEIQRLRDHVQHLEKQKQDHTLFLNENSRISAFFQGEFNDTKQEGLCRITKDSCDRDCQKILQAFDENKEQPPLKTPSKQKKSSPQRSPRCRNLKSRAFRDSEHNTTAKDDSSDSDDYPQDDLNGLKRAQICHPSAPKNSFLKPKVSPEEYDFINQPSISELNQEFKIGSESAKKRFKELEDQHDLSAVADEKFSGYWPQIDEEKTGTPIIQLKGLSTGEMEPIEEMVNEDTTALQRISLNEQTKPNAKELACLANLANLADLTTDPDCLYFHSQKVSIENDPDLQKLSKKATLKLNSHQKKFNRSRQYKVSVGARSHLTSVEGVSALKTESKMHQINYSKDSYVSIDAMKQSTLQMISRSEEIVKMKQQTLPGNMHNERLSSYLYILFLGCLREAIEKDKHSAHIFQLKMMTQKRIALEDLGCVLNVLIDNYKK